MAVSYDELSPEAQEVIGMVKQEFGDMFDNDDFGSWLSDFAIYFDDDRMAALLDIAIGNIIMMMTMTGIYWDVNNYPYQHPVARQVCILSLTIEMIQHLIRSYVEIPDTGRVGAPDVVRRDYLSRWQSVLKDYQDRLKQGVKKLNTEIFTGQQEAGMFAKTLISLPINNAYWWGGGPMPERPLPGVWW